MTTSNQTGIETLAARDFLTPRRTMFGLLLNLEAFQRHGLDVAATLAAAGLPPLALTEPDMALAVERERQVLLRLLDHFRGRREASVLGMVSGAAAGVNVYGVLGLAAIHADTMLDAAKTLLDYPELSWGHSRVALERGRDHAALSCRIDHADYRRVPDLHDFCIARDLTSAARLLGEVSVGDIALKAVQLPFPEPRQRTYFDQHFPCPVEFGAPAARLVFAPDIWTRRPANANPLIRKGYLKMAEKIAADLRQPPGFRDLVLRHLAACDPIPDAPEMATALAITTRTLARRLAQEGCRFSDLRQQVRMGRAEDLLRDQTLPLSTVAERLGYSDLSAFSRAFRDQVGLTPSAWRRSPGKMSDNVK
jgi:AraC-like DNA-binding protein